MSPKQAEVFALRATGLTYSAIARKLGITRSAVQFRVLNARQRPPAPLQVVGDLRFGERPEPDDESPEEARWRVRRELAAGDRCPRCWLILPHDDCPRG